MSLTYTDLQKIREIVKEEVREYAASKRDLLTVQHNLSTLQNEFVVFLKGEFLSLRGECRQFRDETGKNISILKGQVSELQDDVLGILDQLDHKQLPFVEHNIREHEKRITALETHVGLV